jgi:predicted dehydrogenase
MSTSRKIRVGVFGAGRGMTMINVMARHPDAELVAICDKYAPLLDKCRKITDARGLKVAYYEDFEKFFQHDMDAVVLANYANEHAPFAARLLLSGRHVTSEVLPVETMAEAVQLVEAVEKSGKVYTYAENYCYFAATQEMKRLYRAGDIGEFTHGEGEYVHDCESIWPAITYGEKLHWRNRLYSTYYCTHSVGPVLTITGTRPVRVVGFESPNVQNMANVGYSAGTSGMIVAQMSNGATMKSLHGSLKREPCAIWYSIYGQKGMMESDRWHDGVARIHLFKEGDSLTETEVSYHPRARVDTALSRLIQGHGGGDFYTMHYFLEKILGRSGGEESIDVYQAIDMGITGILAYRSILGGNVPLEVPDFRIPANREAFRDDHYCTNPNAPEKYRLPLCSFTPPQIPDKVFEDVRKRWLKEEEEELSL